MDYSFYEYTTIDPEEEFEQLVNEPGENPLEEDPLNDLGVEGWELFTGYGKKLIFRRPVVAWEYKVVDPKAEQDALINNSRTPVSDDEWLNSLAQQGWMLVCIIDGKAYLKRPNHKENSI